jgi:serine/threonine-protein kinase
MMFEMLTGVKPWQPETDLFGAWYKAHHFEAPRTIAEVSPQLKIPQNINNLIMACLAKKASDRPQNIREVLQVLDNTEKSQCANLPITFTPENIPKIPLDSQLFLAVEKNFKQFTWPKNKPIQEIVFPQLLTTNQGTAVTLLLMLPETEIQKQLNSKLYNRFIFVTSPHPMLLWVTLLYTQAFGAKWLPCYLDMQNPYNLRLVSFLADHNSYPLMCFTLEPPNKCTQVLTSHVDLSQRQKLKIWVEQSQKLPPTTQPQLSKNLLKQQYKQLQSQMLERIGDR